MLPNGHQIQEILQTQDNQAHSSDAAISSLDQFLKSTRQQWQEVNCLLESIQKTQAILQSDLKTLHAEVKCIRETQNQIFTMGMNPQKQGPELKESTSQKCSDPIEGEPSQLVPSNDLENTKPFEREKNHCVPNHCEILETSSIQVFEEEGALKFSRHSVGSILPTILSSAIQDCTLQATLDPDQTAQEMSSAANLAQTNAANESPDPGTGAEGALHPPTTLNSTGSQLRRTSSFKLVGKGRPAILESSVEHLLDRQALHKKAKSGILSCYGACAEGTTVRHPSPPPP
jgi:hypothetical protein